MASVPFSATPRTDTGKGVARKLRAAGQVPAVIYGHAREPQPLQLDHHALQLLLEKHPYQSTVIALSIDGTTSNTLIREIQRHPFKKQIVHVDFQELVAGESVTVPVPLQFTGTPEGVRHGGGLRRPGPARARDRLRPGEHPAPHRRRRHAAHDRPLDPRRRGHAARRGTNQRRHSEHGRFFCTP